jgi:hypothetical protein
VKAVYWVAPRLLAGRPGPNESPWDLDEIWAGGVRTIVSLVRVNTTAIRAAGFRHYQVPLHGGFAFFPLLRRWLVGRMLPVVDFIAAEVAAGRPTLVHCHAGKDRTGAVLAGYLIRYQGLSPDEAFRLMRRVNPRAMTAPGFNRLPRLFEARDWMPEDRQGGSRDGQRQLDR